MAQDDYLYQTVYKDPMQEYLDTDVSALRDVPTARDTTLFHKVSPGLTGISIDPYGSGGNYMTEWGRILTEGLDPIQKAQDPASVTTTPVDTPVDTGGGGLDVVDTTPIDTGINPFADIDTGVGEFDNLGPIDTGGITGDDITVEDLITGQQAETISGAPVVSQKLQDEGPTIGTVDVTKSFVDQPTGTRPPDTIGPQSISTIANPEIFDNYAGVNDPQIGDPGFENYTMSTQEQDLGSKINSAFENVKGKGTEAIGELKDKLVELGGKAKGMIVDFGGTQIDVGKTLATGAINYLGKNLFGPVGALLGTALGALPGGPTFQTSKAIEVGLAAPGQTQDKYGINTQSAFGDYDKYNVDRVAELEGIVASQIARGLTGTIQMQELKDRKGYVDRSGAGGDIQPDATDEDITAGSFLGDASVAEAAQEETREEFQDRMAGVETGDASVAEAIAAADRAAAQQAAQKAARDKAAAEAAARAIDRHRGNGGNQGSSTGGGGGGYTGGGWCFDPNTFVQMADGSEKKIKEIQLGDNTKGGEVTGVFQFKASDEIHDYKGVTVAGSHYVKEDGKFIMVQDSPLSVKIDKIPVVYSLDTTGRRIFIKGIEFADYNGDGIAKGFLHNAGLELNGFNKEVLRQVENRLI